MDKIFGLVVLVLAKPTGIFGVSELHATTGGGNKLPPFDELPGGNSFFDISNLRFPDVGMQGVILSSIACTTGDRRRHLQGLRSTAKQPTGFS